MSVFGIVEEIQRIPTQTGPHSPWCLSQMEISNLKMCACALGVLKGGAGSWGRRYAVFHIFVMDIPLFSTLTCPVPGERGSKCASAAVNLWRWHTAILCTWAHPVYIASKWGLFCHHLIYKQKQHAEQSKVIIGWCVFTLFSIIESIARV